MSACQGGTICVSLEFDTEMDETTLRRGVVEELEQGTSITHEDGGFAIFRDGIIAKPKNVREIASHPEMTDGMVERTAKALFIDYYGVLFVDWQSQADDQKALWRQKARIALTAAFGD
jgi:hypothetical protein